LEDFFGIFVEESHTMELKLKRFHALVILCLAAIVVVYVVGQADQAFLLVASNFISPASAFVPALYCLFLTSRYGALSHLFLKEFKQKFWRAWLYLGVGLLLWLLGEILWTVYAIVFAVEIPYPSIADLFWVLGYVPIAGFLIAYLLLFREKVSSKMIAAAGVGALTAAVLVFLVLIGPVFQAGTDPVTQFFNVAYPTLDLVLLAVSLVGLFAFQRENLARFWIWFNLGFILMAVGDVLFSYSTALGFYYAGHPLDLFYYFGYFSILVGLYEHKRAL